MMEDRTMKLDRANECDVLEYIGKLALHWENLLMKTKLESSEILFAERGACGVSVVTAV